MSLDQANNVGISVLGSSSLYQEFMIFVADGSGHTGLTFNLKWGGLTVRSIELDTYVN
jgi:hypothetical protein